MVNKARSYIPDAHLKAYHEANNLIRAFNAEAETLNLKKKKFYKKSNYDPDTFQYAKSRTNFAHPEFDLMNIENVIVQNEKYNVINFAIENYKYKKVGNEKQFAQSLFHAVHVSQHCQIIPSSFQSLNSCIREVIKGWTNGSDSHSSLICDKFNVMTYGSIAYNYNDLSVDAKKLIDQEMRMISISIYHAYSRQSDAVNFTAMIPKRVMASIEPELWLQEPNSVSAGEEIEKIQSTKFPIKLIDTFEFDIPCKKETPVVRFVSNYNFHPLWTYPVESMIIASKKKMLYSIYISCEQKKTFKTAIELGVIKFHPLLEKLIMPVKRVKRASFTNRKSLHFKELKRFEKDDFLSKKSDCEIVNSYKFAQNILDPKNPINAESHRLESEESHRFYGGVKCKHMDEYLIHQLSRDECTQLDLEHQRKHEGMTSSLEHLSDSTSSTVTPKKHENTSPTSSFNQLEKDILNDNRTTPLYNEKDYAEFPDKLADVDNVLMFMNLFTTSNDEAYQLTSSLASTPKNVPRNINGAAVVTTGKNATLKLRTSKKVSKPKRTKKMKTPEYIHEVEEIQTINPMSLLQSPILSQCPQSSKNHDIESLSNFNFDSVSENWESNPDIINYSLSNSTMSDMGDCEFNFNLADLLKDHLNSSKSVQGQDTVSYTPDI